MPSYIDTLSPKQKEVVKLLTDSMNKQGITNPVTQAGILAVVSKESNFELKPEISYKGTSNDRIRNIFKTKLGGKSDAEINALKQNDKAFFDTVYGHNGYKFRGRGFNGLTFEDNYRKIGNKIGVDLVSNPDRLAEYPVAADALIAYFILEFEKAKKSNVDKLKQYNNTTALNDFKTVQDSVGFIYHANAGLGHSAATINADPTGGKAKSVDRVQGFYNLLKSGAVASVEFVKKKPLTTIAITAGVTIILYIVYKKLTQTAK